MTYERDRKYVRCPVDYKNIPRRDAYRGMFCGPSCHATYQWKLGGKWSLMYYAASRIALDHVHKTITKRRERRKQTKVMRNMRKGGGKARRP